MSGLRRGVNRDRRIVEDLLFNTVVRDLEVGCLHSFRFRLHGTRR